MKTSILNEVRLDVAALVQIELPHAVEGCGELTNRILQLRLVLRGLKNLQVQRSAQDAYRE